MKAGFELGLQGVGGRLGVPMAADAMHTVDVRIALHPIINTQPEFIYGSGRDNAYCDLEVGAVGGWALDSDPFALAGPTAAVLFDPHPPFELRAGWTWPSRWVPAPAQDGLTKPAPYTRYMNNNRCI